MLVLKRHPRINSVERPNPFLALALLGLVFVAWTPNPTPDRNVLVDALSATPPRRPDPIPEASLTRRGSLKRLAKTNANVAIMLLLSKADRAVAAYDDAFYGYASSDRSMDAGGNVKATDDNEEEGLRLAKPMGPSENSKPSAPLEYLLPAARVGVYIYGTLSLVEELFKLQTEARGLEIDDPRRPAVVSKARDTVSRIDALLVVSPPSFVRRGDPTVSRGDQYGNNPLPLVGEVGVAAQKQKERTERAIEVGLAPRLFEVGELMGERQQWNRLQRAEQRREGASEIRRAFNIYTTNLNFRRTEYQWVGSQAEKSRRIRSDKLPTTTEVIRSDLDARDLYRNQVQTALEDAKAEWVYQLKESGGGGVGDSDALWKNLDTSELLELLQQATGSVDKWFGFVPERDVKLALDAVQREQEQA